MKRIVIVGAGFAGLAAAVSLFRAAICGGKLAAPSMLRLPQESDIRLDIAFNKPLHRA